MNSATFPIQVTTAHKTSSSAIAETGLQGGLVMAKSGRLELGVETIFTDIIGLSSTTDVTGQQSN